MTKICPQCNHIFTKLNALSAIANCTPPKEGDTHCGKCGTSLVNEDMVNLQRCPKCDALRREKKSTLFDGPQFLFGNKNYLQFCVNCGFNFNK